MAVVQTENGPVVTDSPQKMYTQQKVVYRGYQIVWYILGVIEVLLGFRIILKMLAANPNSGFASLIYAVSELFVAPFYGIFRPAVAGGSVIEWSTIVAMIVYLILAWLIVKLFQFVKPATPDEVEQTAQKV